MKKQTIEEYWRDLSLPWELSSYDRRMSGLGFVEKLATYGRKHISRRKETALRLLTPHLKDKTVLDIGCAGGLFTLELLAKGAARVRGVDISGAVIQEAEKRARALQVDSRAQFFACSIDDFEQYASGSIDLLVGLGILEYLQPSLVRDLLNRVRPKGLLFSFDEKVYTLKTGLHYFYRLAKKIPYYKKYTRPEMAELLAVCGYEPVRFTREGGNSFVDCLK